MFEYGSIVLKQVASMALMMMLGYFLYKKKMFDDTGVNQLSNLLVKVILPILVFVSFQRPYEAGVAKQLVISFLFAGISLAVAVIYAAVIYKGRKHGAQKAAATIFTNNGFMAFPLIEAIVGPEGIFLVAAAAPTGTALPIMEEINGKDTKYTSKLIAATTIASVIFLPVVLSVLEYLQVK